MEAITTFGPTVTERCQSLATERSMRGWRRRYCETRNRPLPTDGTGNESQSDCLPGVIVNTRSEIGASMSRSEEQWRSEILALTSNGTRLRGRVRKGEKHWLADLPALDVMTQGRTKAEARTMVKDMLEALVNLPGFSVQVDPDGQYAFQVTSTCQGQRASKWSRHLAGSKQTATPTSSP